MVTRKALDLSFAFDLAKAVLPRSCKIFANYLIKNKSKTKSKAGGEKRGKSENQKRKLNRVSIK